MGSTQVRVATPSRCTVQAPHCAMPQPNLVPVSPSVSRSTQRSGVSGATSTVSRLPLTVKEIGDMTSFPLLRGLVNNVHRRPAGGKGGGGGVLRGNGQVDSRVPVAATPRGPGLEMKEPEGS